MADDLKKDEHGNLIEEKKNRDDIDSQIEMERKRQEALKSQQQTNDDLKRDEETKKADDKKVDSKKADAKKADAKTSESKSTESKCGEGKCG